MSTSGTTAYAMTARDMVTNAMIDLGALASGGTPSAEELEDGITRLNSMLKTLQARGCGLWRETEGTLVIPASEASGTLPVDIREVHGARHVFSATFERTLEQWERSQYLSLPNKASIGTPSIFYCARQRDQITMYVWPTPTTDATIKLDYERIVETITDGSEDVDVPVIWYETIWKMLAARMTNMFGTDPARVQRVQNEAAALELALLDDDRPASIFMGPG